MIIMTILFFSEATNFELVEKIQTKLVAVRFEKVFENRERICDELFEEIQELYMRLTRAELMWDHLSKKCDL